MKVTRAFKRILETAREYDIIDVQGGAGAGKSFAIEQLLFFYAQSQRLFITVMTDTYDNLKDTNIKDFMDICEGFGYPFEKNYSAQDKTLKFPTGAKIQFRYLNDKHESAGKAKRRDVLFIDEANKFLNWNAVWQFVFRTHKKVFIAYNPDFSFWNDTELPKLKNEDRSPMSKKIILTHKDNNRLPKQEREKLLQRADNERFARVYIRGETGYYSNRQIYTYEWADKLPATAKKINSGMDFGVAPDPTCLVELYVNGADLYCDLKFSENNLMPEKIDGAERMSIVDKLDVLGISKGHPIVADKAGGTERRDLRKHGYNVMMSKGLKPIDGINKLKCYNIKLLKSNEQNEIIARAIEGFFFKIDKYHLDEHGEQMIIPEMDGHEPDTLAAIRYAIEKLIETNTKKLTRGLPI